MFFCFFLRKKSKETIKIRLGVINSKKVSLIHHHPLAVVGVEVL